MNMNPSGWERTIDALCGVAFVAFAVCYGIHRISLLIPGGFKTMEMDAPTLISSAAEATGFGARK
jgi:hypothetical protein